MKQILNKKSYVATVVAFFILLSFPSFVSAETVIRGQETVTISQDQQVEANFYTLGTSVSVSGTVTGDWISIAERITADGVYESDVFLLGRAVQIHGPTTEDARIVALEVTLADTVGGDVVIVADKVKILSGADIAGDLLLFANQVEVEAPVGGNILGRVGTLRINNNVGGEVDITATELLLGERANINGGVVYSSPQELVQAEAATIGGEIKYTSKENDAGWSWQESATNLLIPLLAMVFAALTIFLLAPRRMHNFLVFAYNRFWFTALIGIGVLVFTPFIIFAFLLSGLGSLVGLFVLLLYIILILLGVILAGPLTGYIFSKYILKRDDFDVLSIAVGMVLLYAALLLPLVGFVWLILLISVFLGTVLLRAWAYRK